MRKLRKPLIDTVGLKYVDAMFQEDAENEEIAARAKLPGATFMSAYGQSIYDDARRCLSGIANANNSSSREKEAMWPHIFMSRVLNRAKEPLAMRLPGTPDIEKLEAEREKARMFGQAYQAVSGIALIGGRKIPAHERLKMAQEVPPMLRAQAKELHDNGVCQYSDSSVKLGEKFAHAERDREMLRRGEILRKRGAFSKRRGALRAFIR